MKIRTGDLVKVIAGNEKIKGTVGKVISINRIQNRLVLENGPVLKKHLKAERSRKLPEGGIIERPASIHISNVMLMSESLGRPVRAGSTRIDGKKIRVARGKGTSGEKI